MSNPHEQPSLQERLCVYLSALVTQQSSLVTGGNLSVNVRNDGHGYAQQTTHLGSFPEQQITSVKITAEADPPESTRRVSVAWSYEPPKAAVVPGGSDIHVTDGRMSFTLSDPEAPLFAANFTWDRPEEHPPIDLEATSDVQSYLGATVLELITIVLDGWANDHGLPTVEEFTKHDIQP